MDLTEAEGIKKRWQEHTELYKKDLHDPDNHDGVITDLEPDVLECEVKWALGSITMGISGGGPSCALRGRHCSWERPFHVLLGPQRSASSEWDRGVQTTGKGTGTQWSREPHIPPSLLAQSRSPLTWRLQKGLAFGIKAFTALPLRIKLRPARFSQAA